MDGASIQVQAEAQRGDHAQHLPGNPEAFHLVERLRQRRRARGGRERNQERLPGEPSESTHGHAGQRQAADQDCAEEQRLGQPRRPDERGQAFQGPAAAVRRHLGCGRKDREWRQIHDVIGVTERDLGESVGEVDHRLRPVPDGQAGDAEQEAEHDDLHHVASRQRVDDAGGHGGFEGRKEPGLLRFRRRIRRCKGQARAGTRQERCEPTEPERDRRRDFEADRGLPAEAA